MSVWILVSPKIIKALVGHVIGKAKDGEKKVGQRELAGRIEFANIVVLGTGREAQYTGERQAIRDAAGKTKSEIYASAQPGKTESSINLPTKTPRYRFQ